MAKCYFCMKYGVIYVAFVFLITGLAIVTLSAYLLAKRDTYFGLSKDDEFLRYVVYALIAGGLMLLGGIFGCCGGVKQSSPLLGLFFTIVLIISFAELAAGVFAYVHHDDFSQHFREMLKNSAQNLYRRDEDITRGWDLMQIEMKCCGATGFRDYQLNPLQSQSKGSNENLGFVDMTLSAINHYYSVPTSCCKPDISHEECLKATNIPLTASIPIVGDSLTTTSIYKEGCADKIIDWIEENSPIIIGILIGVGSIQIIILLFTCILICAFRSRRSYKN